MDSLARTASTTVRPDGRTPSAASAPASTTGSPSTSTLNSPYRPLTMGTVLICAANTSVAQDKGKEEAAQLAGESQAALQQLYANVPLAKTIGPTAQAILVFPKVTKAGLGVGGQYGEGALLKGGKAVAYYSTAGASIGLQAGAQTYSYALFFMPIPRRRHREKASEQSCFAT